MPWLKYDTGPIFTDTLVNRDQAPCVDESGYTSEYTKPCGFWITDDSEECWRSWCLSNDWADRITHKHEVDLDENRILILRTSYEVECFSRQYGFEHHWKEGRFQRWCINWPEVAHQHAGIIIAPYQWSLRMKHGFSWYYVWDCASGCIWDVSAIKDVRLVEINPCAAPENGERAA